MARKPEPPTRLVTANTMAPPLHNSRACRPSLLRTRNSTSLIPTPSNSPSRIPRPNCLSRVMAMPKPHWVSGSTSMPTSIRVIKMAMGSLSPDSISRVLATRSLSLTPAPLITLNTAAASVEPIMPPSSSPRRQSTPINQMANAPTRPAEIATPRVARLSAGRRPSLKVLNRVRRPPSSRITARAILPIT